MNKSSNPNKQLRQKLIGLGKTSVHKNYYGDLLAKKQELETQNQQLIMEVEQRLATEEELKRLNEELEHRVYERTLELEDSNESLRESLDELKRTQQYLIQSEKMAAIGSIVAGMSHEINTPLGVSVTTITYIETLIKDLQEALQENTLTKNGMKESLDEIRSGFEITFQNLRKGVELVQSFKVMANDQKQYERRKFNIYEYINSLVNDLRPDLTVYDIEFYIVCRKDLVIEGYPGIILHILSHFITNSIVHGFAKKKIGIISIEFLEKGDYYELLYRDNGEGIGETVIEHIYEPFLTTKRESASGLGLFIIYNLVTEYLNGTIKCISKPNEGTDFIIRIPCN